jgi:hypothetical protein
MSEQWKLDNLDTNPDINDVYQSEVYVKTQLRTHYVFNRHVLLNAENLTFSSQSGASTSIMLAYIGDAMFQMLLGGGTKWICTFDGIVPQDDYRHFAVRRQVWEYYGQWEDAPGGWNMANTPPEPGGS